jgi:hypothetical protein
MNPKIALFLSTTLTAFVVATLSGVVNKVTTTDVKNTPTQAVVQQVATVAFEQPTDLPAPTAQTAIDPLQATTIASQALGHNDVYSVETSTYKGVDAYKVVFSSGDVVYVGLDAQILETTKLKPVVVNVPAPEPTKKHREKSQSQPNGGSGGGNGGEEEHEEEHEHEGGDD